MIRTRLVRWAPLLVPALVLPAVLLSLPPATRAEPPQGRQYAFLVGVKNYNKDELRNLDYTENDVNDLAEVLKGAGYKRVIVLTQSAAADQRDNNLLPTGRNIRLQLQSLLDDRKPGDAVLVAFSGHGVQPHGEKGSYFCPLDAEVTNLKTLVPLAEIYEKLDKCPASVKALLVDACRDDPLPKSGGMGLVKLNLESVTRPATEKAPEGVGALFSCSEGQEAYDSDKFKHGIFFHYVIEGLKGGAANKKGEVTLDGLASYVRDEVPDAAKEERGARAYQLPEMVGKSSGALPLVRAGLRPSPLDCTGERGVSAAEVRRSQEAWAKYLGRKVEEEFEIAPGVKMKCALIPPGKFTMGSPEGEKDRSKDEVQHEVEITKPLYLGVYDVTQAQYEAVTGKTPSHFKGEGNLPVETVSWDEADAFAKGLTEKAKGGLLYRLPTEAEWEYSCRGGRPSSQPFGIGDGTSLSSREANFDGNYPYGGAEKGPYLEKTTAVGHYDPNALGLYDMQGNVWQWCSDWYADYPTGRVVNPEGPGSGSSRVDRGGGWNFIARYCRAAFRFRNEPGVRSSDLGFRLAVVPSGLSK